MRVRVTTPAWAIQTGPVRPGFVGVGWLDWGLARAGLTVMTFATRRAARAALATVRGPHGFPRARVVRVTVTVEAAGADRTRRRG